MTVYKWSTTAASNATADGSIGLAEGMAPSGLNDAGRAIMAATKKWFLDIGGGLTTGGTSVAYTLTTNQTFGSLASADGAMLGFTVHITNTSSPTLNVDGLGAKPIKSITGSPPASSTMV